MHGSERPTASPPRLAADPFASGSDSVPQPGPVFSAGYDSECASATCYLGGDIEEGDDIRADGEGGFVHSECWED
jgi:hypothetical protein